MSRSNPKRRGSLGSIAIVVLLAAGATVHDACCVPDYETQILDHYRPAECVDLASEMQLYMASTDFTDWSQRERHRFLLITLLAAFAEHVEYNVYDPDNYWKYPYETIADGQGDCEDTAMAFASAVAHYPLPYDVFVCQSSDHVWVEFDDGIDRWLLETTSTGLFHITPGWVSPFPESEIDYRAHTRVLVQTRED